MAISTVLFIIAGLIVVFRYWLTEPTPKNDGAGLITGAIMFVALVIAAAGALVRVAGAHDHGCPSRLAYQCRSNLSAALMNETSHAASPSPTSTARPAPISIDSPSAGPAMVPGG